MSSRLEDAGIAAEPIRADAPHRYRHASMRRHHTYVRNPSRLTHCGVVVVHVGLPRAFVVCEHAVAMFKYLDNFDLAMTPDLPFYSTITEQQQVNAVDVCILPLHVAP